MKRIFMVLFYFLFYASIGYGQSTQVKINGIGLFKLGGNKNKILDSLKSIKSDSITYNQNNSDYLTIRRENLAGIYQYNGIDGGILCSDQDCYYLNELTIGEITLHSILIKFYKDSLYHFECSGSNELNAIWLFSC